VSAPVLNPNEPTGNIISLPRTGDGFIAETAVKLDRLQAIVTSLDHETRESKKALSELSDVADRARRNQAFEESLRNAREYKIDEMVRACRDLKARLDEDKQRLKKLTFAHTISPLENPMSIRGLRKDISRLKTELRKRELGI